MSTDDIDDYVRDNVQWADLPGDIKLILGNSGREYEKRVLDYSIKNQLRHKGNIVRFVKKKAEEYYEMVLNYSIAKLMLYPYHLADVFVCGLRVTPFEYYITMISNIMREEKSYDSLPNFTAADAVRLLGIGRNQYIDMMNQSRSFRKLFRRKSVSEILPTKPVEIPIEPWFMACAGCILDSDIKQLVIEEKEVVDRLVEGFPLLCGLLDRRIVQSLYNRGLIYLEVPISDEDYIYVPTLDGFVMNRVQGDYFENLLYKIFVTIDGQMSVKELSEVLNIDKQLVKNALSVFCRLGFARKRLTGIEEVTIHTSWEKSRSSVGSTSMDGSFSVPSGLAELSSSLTNTTGPDDDDDAFESEVDDIMKESVCSPTSTVNTPIADSSHSRIAFIFDSSLTAFLMMGNLSAKLKNCAVTLFEVGKLSDDAVQSFAEELANVNFFVEGEAQRYSEHASTLLHTINSLRRLKTSTELDLIRGESLMSLDANTRQRVIQKSYKLLIGMAPLSTEACAFSKVFIPHIGAPIVEMISPWFRLYLYSLIGEGPSSLFYPMGTCVKRLPREVSSKRLVFTTGNHEPSILMTADALVYLNDTLSNSPVFLQEYSNDADDSEIVNVVFPFEAEESDEQNFVFHPSLKILREKLHLDTLCGYVTLIRRKTRQCDDSEERADKSESDSPQRDSNDADSMTVSPFKWALSSTITKDPRKVKSNKTHLDEGESFSDFIVFDCVFGIPLFDEHLNKAVCRRIIEHDIFFKSFENILFAVQNIVDSTKAFVARNCDSGFNNSFGPLDSNCIPLPTRSVLFHSGEVRMLSSI